MRCPRCHGATAHARWYFLRGVRFAVRKCLAPACAISFSVEG